MTGSTLISDLRFAAIVAIMVVLVVLPLVLLAWDSAQRVLRLRHCEILDLSLGGARLRCSASMEPGNPLVLGIGRFGMIAGEVVWNRSGVTGIKYTDRFPVVQSVLAPLLPEPCMAV